MTRVYSQELTRVQPLVFGQKTDGGINSVFFQNSGTICNTN